MHTVYHKAGLFHPHSLPAGGSSISVRVWYLYTGILLPTTGRGWATPGIINGVFHSNTFSIPSSKVTLSETIPSSLPNLPVLTLSSQQWVSRRPGKHAAVKQICISVLSRVYTQIMFSASWRLTKPSNEILGPWIPVLPVHDTLRWSQALMGLLDGPSIY